MITTLMKWHKNRHAKECTWIIRTVESKEKTTVWIT